MSTRVALLSLAVVSPDHNKIITMDPSKKFDFKKNPITIKEGTEFNVRLEFRVDAGFVSGLRYVHQVKRAGIKVDELEEMLGAYEPLPEGQAYTRDCQNEESPSGVVSRAGMYDVHSKLLDDDGEVYADFKWSYKLSRDW